MYYKKTFLRARPRANCWVVEQIILRETMFSTVDAKHELIPGQMANLGRCNRAAGYQ